MNAGQSNILLTTLLPLAAVLLGAVLCLVGIEAAGREGWRTFSILRLSLGAALIVAGLAPVVLRWSRPNLADAWVLAMASVCAMLCAGLFALQLWLGPEPRTLTGELVGVAQVHGRRLQSPDHLELRVAGQVDVFRWRCLNLRCADGAHILALRSVTPVQASLRLNGSEVVGLNVEGRSYLDVGRERARNRAFLISAVVAMLTLAGAGIFLSVERVREGGS